MNQSENIDEQNINDFHEINNYEQSNFENMFF